MSRPTHQKPLKMLEQIKQASNGGLSSVFFCPHEILIEEPYPGTRYWTYRLAEKDERISFRNSITLRLDEAIEFWKFVGEFSFVTEGEAIAFGKGWQACIESYDRNGLGMEDLC